MKVVVNTPSGNVGHAAVERLLDKKAELVIISRHPEKVRDYVARGAVLIEGSMDDRAVLEKAFRGADALLWVTPLPQRPDHTEWAPKTAAMAAEIAARSGIDRIVVLSSMGADSKPGLGPIGVLYHVEEAFRKAGGNVTVLRAAMFMENLLHDAGGIAAAGAIHSTADGRKRIPWVATRDVGEKAAALLLDSNWHGQRILGVHGPKDLSYAEVATAVETAVGRPVRYVSITPDQAKQQFHAAGMPDFAVDLFADMMKALAKGRIESAEPRTSDSTTPTTIAAFARTVLKPKVEAAAAHAEGAPASPA